MLADMLHVFCEGHSHNVLSTKEMDQKWSKNNMILLENE